MIQIRQGVFETNSSSTHSITMCMESDYNKWKNGDVYFVGDTCYASTKYKGITWLRKDQLNEYLTTSKYPPKDNLEDMSEDDIQKLMNDYDIYSFESFRDRYDGMESYVDSFETPSGKVIAFGYYGYDG